MNGSDKLVRGLTDNGAMVESTVNILISDVVVTDEGNSEVVVTVTVGVISGSKLLSVIKSITLSVDWLVMDTTPDVIIKDGVINAVTVETIKVLDCITVSVSVPVLVLLRSTVAVTGGTNNVSVVSKLLRILLDIIISVDCITEGTISDEGEVIVDKVPIVITSVNNIVEFVID